MNNPLISIFIKEEGINFEAIYLANKLSNVNKKILLIDFDFLGFNEKIIFNNKNISSKIKNSVFTINNVNENFKILGVKKTRATLSVWTINNLKEELNKTFTTCYEELKEYFDHVFLCCSTLNQRHLDKIDISLLKNVFISFNFLSDYKNYYSNVLKLKNKKIIKKWNNSFFLNWNKNNMTHNKFVSIIKNISKTEVHMVNDLKISDVYELDKIKHVSVLEKILLEFF